MTNNETYTVFIIISINYIRLFGINNYIELYRKKVDDVDDNKYRKISNIEIPPIGHEYIKYRYMYTHNGRTTDYIYSLYSAHSKLRQEESNLLKVLKRALKIHKLNNDN